MLPLVCSANLVGESVWWLFSMVVGLCTHTMLIVFVTNYWFDLGCAVAIVFSCWVVHKLLCTYFCGNKQTGNMARTTNPWVPTKSNGIKGLVVNDGR